MKYRVSMVALAAAASLGMASTGAQAQTAGLITGSPHDLSSGAPENPDKNEVCVYCHTPHGAEGASVGVPLWNKAVGSPTAYTLYDAVNSSTIDGEILGSVGGVSLACLSCHDGTQATDSVINQPGTGGYTAGTGAEIDATPGPLLDTGIARIADGGTDLSNDHPIAIVYGGFGSPQVDPEFVTAALVPGSTNLWYIDRTGSDVPGDRDKKDIIFYTRDTAAATPAPFVECGTCHDPHSGSGETMPNAAGSDVSFMRVANDDSALCLSCHVK
ncbi:MAG: cytochrome c3 family protein [Rhodospirillales bacterium]